MNNQRPKLNFVIFIILLLFFLFPAIIYYTRVQAAQAEWDNNQLLMTVTTPYRGEKSERDIVLMLLKMGIPAKTIFHDLYVSKGSGHYSQIDIALVSRVGIIVLEIKDYSGWIYGNGFNEYWTKVLAYGKEKYKFYNPIKQNAAHIKALQRLLCEEEVLFYNIVVFDGHCKIKGIGNTPDKTGVFYARDLPSVISYIINNNPQANYKDISKIIDKLKQAALNGNDSNIVAQHNKNVNNFLMKKTKSG